MSKQELEQLQAEVKTLRSDLDEKEKEVEMLNEINQNGMYILCEVFPLLPSPTDPTLFTNKARLAPSTHCRIEILRI